MEDQDDDDQNKLVEIKLKNLKEENTKDKDNVILIKPNIPTAIKKNINTE